MLDDIVMMTSQEAEGVQWQTIRTGALPVWTITRNTTDYPEKLCARITRIGNGNAGPTRYVLLADDLETLRDLLPRGLTVIARDPSDPATVVECWI